MGHKTTSDVVGQVSFTRLLNLHWSSLLHSFAGPLLVKSLSLVCSTFTGQVNSNKIYSSEVASKTILMGHPGLSFYVPVVRSNFKLIIP